MVLDYNHQAAVDFVKALRAGDRKEAFYCANKVTMDPDAINYGASLDKDYNDSELADLIEKSLDGVSQGRWDMTTLVHLPVVIGAILYWLTKEQDDDGKTDSKSIQQGKEHDVSGP